MRGCAIGPSSTRLRRWVFLRRRKRGWCRNPDYLVGALGAKERYARFSAPLRLYWMADDPYAPLAAAQALLRLYPRAPSELKRVAPRELGAERIGHFGFFREQFRDTLWRDAADWLERH